MTFGELTDLTNNRIYRVRCGAIINESLTDELDSATVIVPFVEDCGLASYDLVKYTNEFEIDSYWLVADVSFSYVDYERKLKDYTINLMELTKILECVQLPSMAVTNIGQNRTISTYVNNAMKYFNRQFQNDYGVSRISLPKAFDNVVCAELTIAEPSLREYLDYLLQFKGYRAMLRYNNGIVLTARNLNANADESISIGYVTKIEGSISASDYVTILDHSITDVVSNVAMKEKVHLTTDDYVLNTKNAEIKLSHNIYDLKSVNVKMTSSSSSNSISVTNVISVTLDGGKVKSKYTYKPNDAGSNKYVYLKANDYLGTYGIRLPSVDITPFVVQENIYNSLEMTDFSNLNNEIINGNKHSYNTMFWKRGSNSIGNIMNYQSKQVLNFDVQSLTAIESAFLSGFIQQCKENRIYHNKYPSDITNDMYYLGSIYGGHLIFGTNDSVYSFSHFQDFQSMEIDVEYYPYVSPRIQLEQNLEHKHKIVMQDNSTNAMTDIKKFIDASYEKNNQLGNDSLIMQAIVPYSVSTDKYYELGMYYVDNGNYILTKLEYQYRPNYAFYKGVLTKNYSNRNINNVLNREKRYYSLADTSDSVERKEFTKVSIRNSNNIPNALLYACEDTNNPSYTIYGIIPASFIYTSNVTIINGVFMDNAVAYKRHYYKNNLEGYRMENVLYVNSCGEAQNFKVWAVNYAGDTNFAFGSYYDTLEYKMTQYHNSYPDKTKVELLNMVANNIGCYAYGEFDILKDNREQLNLTLIVE